MPRDRRRPLRPQSRGPHLGLDSHEDKLGFWLFAYGHHFLVDPGRHLYDTSEVSFLPHLRSTRAHSTITVDNQGQHSRGKRDTWIPKGPAALNWSVGEGEARASAAYDLGYGEDNALDAVHRREMVFVKERFWVVFDWVEGQGKRRIDSRFQFGPCDLEWDGVSAHTGFEDANLLLWSIGTKPFASVEARVGRKNPREGWYSRRYGLIEPAPCLVFSSDQE
ncbi:MAG: heparinase II/III-family protein, partial [Planctomycetes bacterium]|nr:heparinase II/III-family protein [Planctomycetota bacterium]